jgi:predicted NBD/HSP70 family sugar kinase
VTSDLNPTQRRTLALLRVHGPLSRAELAVKLGLSRPALTEISRTLSELGYIEEHGVGGNSRGQPKINLRLRARAACVVGVFIQKDRIRLLTVDITGEPLGEDAIGSTPEDPEVACQLIATRIDLLIRRHGIARKRLLSVGVATTGFFVGDGDRVWPPTEMARWREFPLKSKLENLLGLTVFLENDGNAAALAEYMKGAGRSFRSFLYVYLAYGVGGGFVQEGRIFTGAHGNACEIGRLVPPAPAIRPTLTSLALYLKRPVASITAEEISAWFAAGDGKLMKFLDEAVKALHPSLAAAVILFDPAEIIIGGKFPPEVLRWIIDHLDISHADTATIPLLPKPQVILSEISQIEAGLWGAALLPLHEFMSPPAS